MPKGKQITCTLSCMSRAGREPGFKKQNQDNCFAFEKYVAAGQALFGAFDGHGPNGKPLPFGFVKSRLLIKIASELASDGPGLATEPLPCWMVLPAKCWHEAEPSCALQVTWCLAT